MRISDWIQTCALPISIEWAFARVEECRAMRALWTKLRDRAGDDRDARFPARMGAAIENIGVMRGAIDVPEGESDMRVIVRVGEERDRQDIGLQFRLPEIADIAADTRQQAIIYPFCL